jgi:hypothetical protein
VKRICSMLDQMQIWPLSIGRMKILRIPLNNIYQLI